MYAARAAAGRLLVYDSGVGRGRALENLVNHFLDLSLKSVRRFLKQTVYGYCLRESRESRLRR